MVPNFVAVISVLLPICCHNGSGMQYLCISVEEVCPLLGAMTDKWVYNKCNFNALANRTRRLIG